MKVAPLGAQPQVVAYHGLDEGTDRVVAQDLIDLLCQVGKVDVALVFVGMAFCARAPGPLALVHRKPVAAKSCVTLDGNPESCELLTRSTARCRGRRSGWHVLV